jgi:hypothetical protein
MNMENPSGREKEVVKFDFQSPRSPQEWMNLLNGMIGKIAFGIEVTDRDLQNKEMTYDEFAALLKDNGASMIMISATMKDNEVLEAGKDFLAKVQKKETNETE